MVRTSPNVPMSTGMPVQTSCQRCDLCDGGAESAPLGWNRVKVSENLGATAVAPVAPAVTSLDGMCSSEHNGTPLPFY